MDYRAAQGNANDAIHRLRTTIAEVTEYDMLTEAAAVAVDLAEILHATGRLREIPRVLSNVVETFMNAGKLTSALAALAYLKEAAVAGTMTTHMVAYVRASSCGPNAHRSSFSCRHRRSHCKDSPSPDTP